MIAPDEGLSSYLTPNNQVMADKLGAMLARRMTGAPTAVVLWARQPITSDTDELEFARVGSALTVEWKSPRGTHTFTVKDTDPPPSLHAIGRMGDEAGSPFGTVAIIHEFLERVVSAMRAG